MTDEEIQELSKAKFKNVIMKKIENYALAELNKLKMKHEKSDYLNSSSFKTAQYLVDEKFSKSEAQLLFKLRSTTLNQDLLNEWCHQDLCQQLLFASLNPHQMDSQQSKFLRKHCQGV